MQRHEAIGDVRGGHGLMVALEFVSDRTTKAADKATPLKVQQTAYEQGSLVRVSGPNIILSPPLIISAAEVESIIAALDTGLHSLKS